MRKSKGNAKGAKGPAKEQQAVEQEVLTEDPVLQNDDAETLKDEDEISQSAEEQDTPEKDLDNLKKQLAELNDSLLRGRAEFANFRKRTQSEKARWSKDAQENLVLAILPVKDDLERMLAQADEKLSVESLSQGLRLVSGKLDKCLEGFAVKPFASEGESFDPDLHNALTTMEDPEKDDEIVLMEHLKGYRMGDRVIRHAQVVVNKNESDS